jgi:hypothetical protein
LAPDSSKSFPAHHSFSFSATYRIFSYLRSKRLIWIVVKGQHRMSASTSQRSRFRQAVEGGLATTVPMNGLNCVVFSQTPCIGTDGLGSCSVVLIVSPLAAILAHIPPRPGSADANDPETGDKYVQSFMERVTTYYRQCQAYFPANSTSWVVCAVFGDAIALPDQQSIMERALRDVGLTVGTSQTYRVPFTNDFRDRGTVFVDGRGQTIQVYVENRELQSVISPSQPSQTTAVTSAAAASPSYAITQLTSTPHAAVSSTTMAAQSTSGEG